MTSQIAFSLQSSCIPKMDFSQSQSHRHPSKRNKKRLTYDQLRLLETNFNHDTRLEPERKIQLARELGLPPRQIAIWYQNKRARWKTQSLELSYRSLQIKLDNALADKRRLESEMGTLRVELERTQQMLLGLHPSPPSISSFLTSCDEDGSSSLPDDRNYSWENDRVLQVEELYAYLMD